MALVKWCPCFSQILGVDGCILVWRCVQFPTEFCLFRVEYTLSTIFWFLKSFLWTLRTWGNPKKSMALSNLVNRQATEFHHFYWSDDQEMQVWSNLSSVFSSGLCSLNPGRSNITNLSATFGVDFLCVAIVILKIKDPMIARDDIAYQTVTFSE